MSRVYRCTTCGASVSRSEVRGSGADAYHLSGAFRCGPVDGVVNKYHVAPAAARTVDGIRFDSKAEMRRYQELLLLQRGGYIHQLELQPPFVLIEPFTDSHGHKHRGVKYIGDFAYKENGRTVVEDCKGVRTREFVIKAQLFAQRYPEVDFREVRPRRQNARR